MGGGQQENLLDPSQGRNVRGGLGEVAQDCLDAFGFHGRPGVLPTNHDLERGLVALEVLDEMLADLAGGTGN
jgi:hypothetical protein